ncbi:MAG: translesion error-prone DNA polymerase V autoproteolytic subunit [Firmicutes bacterium]|nr:translesion error-prone DNA polymerase V autoproteolytic subunit [Bacillota bacterium]
MKIKLFHPNQNSKLALPAVSQISAGFPSPAEDYLEAVLDLNQALVKNPSSTFYGTVRGCSMTEAGVDNGDLLVIDKSLPYRHQALAVCYLDGEFTLKRIKVEGQNLYLMPANPRYEPIMVHAEQDFYVWGIVTYVIKKVY